MPTPHMKLNLPKIRELYYRHGTKVLYKRAEPCECGSVGDIKTPDYSCTKCNGIGARYYDPIHMIVIMTQKNTKQSIEKYGLLETGTIAVSIADEFRDYITGEEYREFIPGSWDLIECLHDKMRHSQILTKGSEHPINGSTLEKAAFLNVIPGSCRISQVDGTVYIEGKDYAIIPDTIGNNRIVSWLDDGDSPKDGDRYSFTFLTHPTYCLFDILPKHRREDSLMIMTSATAKLVSLVEMFQ